MKDKLKNRNLFPAALLLAGLVLLGARAPQRSSAYFTTHVRTAGDVTITLSDRSEFHEEVSGFEKRLTVSNEESDAPIFARIKILAGSTIKITPAGDGWFDGGDGYWYYSLPLRRGAVSSVLVLTIEPDGELKRDFNVVCAQESVPAVYDAAGNPINPVKANWERGVA